MEVEWVVVVRGGGGGVGGGGGGGGGSGSHLLLVRLARLGQSRLHRILLELDLLCVSLLLLGSELG